MARPQIVETMVRNCKQHGDTIFRIDKRKGRRATWRCLKCNSHANTTKNRSFKQRIVDIAGGKCAICSYDSYIGALEFHHIDPSNKGFELNTNSRSRKWSQVLAEIEKCVLLCSNCHKEVHDGMTLLTDRKEQWICQTTITSAGIAEQSTKYLKV
jgi:5-methylcytosine-specific restriction endonuclease McrA